MWLPRELIITLTLLLLLVTSVLGLLIASGLALIVVRLVSPRVSMSARICVDNLLQIVRSRVARKGEVERVSGHEEVNLDDCMDEHEEVQGNNRGDDCGHGVDATEDDVRLHLGSVGLRREKKFGKASRGKKLTHFIDSVDEPEGYEGQEENDDERHQGSDWKS